MTIVLFTSCFVLLVLGVPVAFSLGIAALVAILASDGSVPLMAMSMTTFSGLDSFPLMAIPFFLLAAELMTGGALTEVLLRFAAQFVGHVRGGLGHTNILVLTFFSGISGSALADAAGPGSMMIRMMDKAGYGRDYAAALTASTAIVGPIIPPSIIMIIYALVDERVSVAELFVAGIVPGILIAAAMACVNHYVSCKRDYRAVGERPSTREMLVNTWKALPALVLPVIILGGIHGGLFTPTEASVVAVFYALAVGAFLYRTLSWKSIPHILLRSALLTCAVLMIVAMAQAFAWVLTITQIPQAIAHGIAALDLSPLVLLLVVNVFLLLFGIFIEPLPGIMVLTPILAPLAASAGIDPLHFAIVVIVNLTLGLITPPVGGLLFVTSIVAKVPTTRLVSELWPFLWAHLAVLLLLTLVPAFSTALPRALGY